MKKNRIAIIFVCMCLSLLVGCWGYYPLPTPAPTFDPYYPTDIRLIVKVAKVQINNSLKITYAITPATAQNDNVTIELNNELATYTKEGNNTIMLKAGDKEGTVKITVKTSNGFTATKTIKIQLEAVESYPDLNGYKIKIAQAGHALGEYDVNLTQETADQYGYYGGADRDERIQAWKEVEDNYNCILAVEAYPSDAPWGPSRWDYIITRAQDNTVDFDYYVVPYSKISDFALSGTIQDLSEWYNKYGENIMNNVSISSGTYKQKLYSIDESSASLYNLLIYNVDLLREIQKIDSSIKEPAQIYLDGKWNYDSFKEYCTKIQTILDDNFSNESSKYYCLSGYGASYWLGMSNASGIIAMDTTQLKVSLTDETQVKAAQTLKELFAIGAVDKEQTSNSWRMGESLFNSTQFNFNILSTSRFDDNGVGGEIKNCGYVPYPAYDENYQTYIGTQQSQCIVMASNREFAYRGFGYECTSENIYRAFLDYLNTSKRYFINSENYDNEKIVKEKVQKEFCTEASIEAYTRIILGELQNDGLYINGINEEAFYEPMLGEVVPGGSYYGPSSISWVIFQYIKGSEEYSDWSESVSPFYLSLSKKLIEYYG